MARKMTAGHTIAKWLDDLNIAEYHKTGKFPFWLSPTAGNKIARHIDSAIRRAAWDGYFIATEGDVSPEEGRSAYDDMRRKYGPEPKRRSR